MKRTPLEALSEYAAAFDAAQDARAVYCNCMREEQITYEYRDECIASKDPDTIYPLWLARKQANRKMWAARRRLLSIGRKLNKEKNNGRETTFRI